jgi:hypothetical protein
MDATPGLSEAGNEFYSVAGAGRLAGIIPTFSKGRAIIGVCGAHFKCPPAPSEAALLLHDHLSARGLREQCQISFVIPFGTPVPPSPDTSSALLAAFAERDIEFVPGRRVSALDAARRVAVLDDGSEMPYDLFLGVPKHRAPDVVLASGMAEGDYVPVEPRTLQTRFPGVYAVGDVADVGVPKAGVFAEGALAWLQPRSSPQPRAVTRHSSTTGAAPATSSSVPVASVAWTWTSSPGPSPPAPSRSPPALSSPTSSTLAQAAAPAGSASEPSRPRCSAGARRPPEARARADGRAGVRVETHPRDR